MLEHTKRQVKVFFFSRTKSVYISLCLSPQFVFCFSLYVFVVVVVAVVVVAVVVFFFGGKGTPGREGKESNFQGNSCHGDEK